MNSNWSQQLNNNLTGCWYCKFKNNLEYLDVRWFGDFTKGKGTKHFQKSLNVNNMSYFYIMLCT